jgi:site-specific recombinase XerD
MVAKSPKLLEQVRESIRTKHYSYRTEQTYVDWIKRFILFHGKRHPKEMGAEEVQEYITYLANERQVASSTQNQALSAITFYDCDIVKGLLGNVTQTSKVNCSNLKSELLSVEKRTVVFVKRNGVIESKCLAEGRATLRSDSSAASGYTAGQGEQSFCPL